MPLSPRINAPDRGSRRARAGARLSVATMPSAWSATRWGWRGRNWIRSRTFHWEAKMRLWNSAKGFLTGLCWTSTPLWLTQS